MNLEELTEPVWKQRDDHEDASRWFTPDYSDLLERKIDSSKFKQEYECEWIPEPEDWDRGINKYRTIPQMIDAEKSKLRYKTETRINTELELGEGIMPYTNEEVQKKTIRTIVQLFVFDQDPEVPAKDSLVFESEKMIGDSPILNEDLKLKCYAEFQEAVVEHNKVRKELGLKEKEDVYSKFDTRVNTII